MFSLLYYPAGIVPITSVKKEEEHFDDGQNDLWTKNFKKSAEGSAGLPICIQVVGYNYEDEKVLEIMESLDKRVGFKPFP
jgi:hypothetical protein